MKTMELPVEEVIPFLAERVTAGDVLHGSLAFDLANLKPQPTESTHFDPQTGVLYEPTPLVYATDVPAAAIFYTVHKLVQATGASRGSGVYTYPDANDKITYEYLLSLRGKQIVRQHAGRFLGAVYFAPTEAFDGYNPKENEWESRTVVSCCGSIAIASACLPFLPFNIAELRSPNNHLDVRPHLDRLNIPTETPPESI